MKNIVVTVVLFYVLNAANWTVNSGNFYYSPSTLEIDVGDNVTWINEGGFHDVNGQTNTISGNSFNNPEPFYVGPPTSGSVIGDYTFNIPGVYFYDCSVGSHAANGMVGTIIVNSLDVQGCTDLNAITCDDNVDMLYFPECSSCSEGVACDNYYNPNATVDNGSCMYNDVPTDEEFQITLSDNGCDLNWSTFTPPVNALQYVLQRCLDPDGDTDGDGEYEYENCTMVIAPGSNFLGVDYYDEFDTTGSYFKYTFYVHYPNNNYWGSAFKYYYYEGTSQCVSGDLNEDGLINVQDIISLVNAILAPGSLADICAADLNDDGNLNVQDIVGLVNLILSL
tara:strand:+ start:4079 stop:5089 length:1011 start_codon:yes stop_codon:yes gene_type:complete